MAQSHGNKQKHESKNPVQRALIADFHRAVAKLVREAQPASILDVGCGEGYVLAALRAEGIRCRVTGVDLSAEAIREASVRVPSAELRVADALTLADEGAQFDVVLMLEVLEHLEDPARMLTVLARLARKRVVLSVPWEPFFRGLNLARGKHITRLGNDPEHVRHWGRDDFLDFVGSTFRVCAQPWAFPWTLVAAEPR